MTELISRTETTEAALRALADEAEARFADRPAAEVLA